MLLTITLLFLAGIFEGAVEALRFRYKTVKKLLPLLSDQFWDPSISHTNKYKNHNPKLGPKFLLSTNALVWVTDGYHLCNFLANNLLFTALALLTYKEIAWIPLDINTNWYILINSITLHVIYSAGNSLVVDLIIKK
jgi:hypothetical protein